MRSSFFVPGSSLLVRSCLLAFLGSCLIVAAIGDEPGAKPDEISRFVERRCLDCHDDGLAKGDLNLVDLPWTLEDADVRSRWVRIYDRVEAGEMPPQDKARDLPNAERTGFLTTARDVILAADRAEVRTQGRGTPRRLTRTEYEDNLRDLLRLPNLDIADHLPEDRDSHGFTRVSGLLDMSRIQLEAYLNAAEAALRQAIASGTQPPPARDWRFTGMDLFPATTTFGGREAMFFVRNGKWVPNPPKDPREKRRDPTLELALFRSATWPNFGYPQGMRAPRDGAYRVRFSGRAVRQLPGFRIVPAYEPLPMSFRARQPSGPDVSGDVRETGGWMDLQPEAREFETTVTLKKGETFEYSLLGLPVPFIRTDGGFFYDYPPMPPDGHRGAAFQWMEVRGPISPESWPPESHRVLFGDLPIQDGPKGIAIIPGDAREDASRLFRRFAVRAARKPVSEEAQQVYRELIFAKLDEGAPFAEAMLQGYQAFLCSGHFLYLMEPKSNDDFALANQLSHLLWNSRPDEALLALADAGALAQPEALRAEAERMIADGRFSRFVDHFTRQWLDLAELRRDLPDERLYPEYRRDDYLVDSMERETQQFFAAMVRENLPVTALVDSAFTFVNDRLAAHYGLPRVSGSTLRKVELPDWSPYGGLLTQASILKLTANGTTTSPVHRGVWVMEKLLGDPPPPPPKSVPAIEPDIRGATTIREQLAKHTKAKSCAACHARFDPVGFALENFDVMGAWRDRYRGMEKGEKITGIDRAGHPFEYRIGAEVDAGGKLRTGETFADVQELKALLAARPRTLARNLLRQLTLYATGTKVRFSDRSEIERILDSCAKNGYRVRDLMLGLVESRIFKGS